jgi:hypothetical protein
MSMPIILKSYRYDGDTDGHCYQLFDLQESNHPLDESVKYNAIPFFF